MGPLSLLPLNKLGNKIMERLTILFSQQGDYIKGVSSLALGMMKFLRSLVLEKKTKAWSLDSTVVRSQLCCCYVTLNKRFRVSET